jgi:2-polyprenyl-6-methoxyphenol hydroxylase-like FAD-dependent oxidoreductase
MSSPTSHADTVESEVLVIGAGPVGLALAGDLGWRGRRCLLIEQGDGSIGQPKMDLVGIRTMEFCRRWGIAGDVEASPYNRDYPQDNVYLTALNGFELGRQPMPSMREDRPPPESPQKRERCPQNMFDPILRKFAESQPATRILYKHRFLSFEQDAEGVIAHVVDLDSMRRFAVRARYLVGCDGGRSAVREQLGIAMHGKGVLTYTTNMVFRCRDFNRLHDKRPGYRYMFVGPTGTWATIVAINGHDQWRMSIIGNAQEKRQYSEDDLKALAHKALGRPFELEILSVLRWQRAELVAERYHSGRVFICGDACHLTSPTGGLGMNTGIADAVDLSWKLTAALEGWGGPALLASYCIERKPVAVRITRFSTGNLEIMKQVPTSDQIAEDSEQGRAIRRRAGHALGEGLKREWFSLSMHLGNRYMVSPVCLYPEPESSEQIAAEDADAMHYRPTSRPGCRAPHVWLRDGRSLLDLFGRGFVLLVFDGPLPDADDVYADDVYADEVCEVARDRGVPLQAVRIDEAAARAIYQKRYVLVRPDGHVAWRGDVLPEDAGAMLAIVTGHRRMIDETISL